MKTNPVFYSCCSKHPLMKPHNGIWRPPKILCIIIYHVHCQFINLIDQSNSYY